jgi:adenylate cyclase
VVPDLRRKLENVRAELRGERREVVMLFADLSGFTSISERMDAEEIGFVVSRFLNQLAEAVHRYGGHVDKYIGDAIMALFGAPVAHENDPERAVLAGMAMLEVIASHNRTESTPLSLRIGINLGEVVAGNLGSAAEPQYTVVGDAVNVASRLEGRAQPNTILVSEPVWNRVAHRFTAERLDPLTLKGKAAPVQGYRIVGLRAQAAQARPQDMAFVGREAEVETVVAFLERASRGEAGALVLEGEAGVGKSRLSREALARWSGGLVLQLDSSPVRLPAERAPAAALFEQIVSREAADGGAVERALALLDGEPGAHRAGLEDLAHEADPTLPPAAEAVGDPRVARQNRWLALAALLRARAAVEPIALFVEDVHWMEEDARELVDFLLAQLAGRRFAALLTTRPLTPEDWLPAGAERLAVQPLGPEAAETLLGELLEEEADKRRELIRRSQGNPLFLVELARALRESSILEGHATVPATLQGLLVSRIDRLDPAVRGLLQTASVLGFNFPTRLLERMYAVEPHALGFERALRTLEGTEFLEPDDGEDARHRFRHALVQEAAYGGLLLRIRKVLHETAARLGQEHYADRIDTEAPFFAHHYWEAGLPEAAAPHLWTAGRVAAERYDLPAAERFLLRVAEVIGSHPTVLGEAADRARLHETLGTVLLHRGKLDDAETQFTALESGGERADRREWRARGREYRGRVAWYRGALEEARRLFESGLALIPDDDGVIAADLHNDLGIVCFYRGLPDEAFDQHGRALELRRGLGDRLGMAKSLSNIGNLIFEFRDDLPVAEDHYRRALDLARAVGDRQMVCSTIHNLGGVALERGEWERAIELLQDSRRIQEEIGWSYLGWLTLQQQALCEIALGRVDSGLRHLQSCLERGDALLEPFNRVNLRLYLFDACVRVCADEAAERWIGEARRVAGELGVNEKEEEIRLREGRWAGVRGDWDLAADLFAGAEEAARHLHHPTLEVLASGHRQRALARAGRPERWRDPKPVRDRPPLDVLLEYLKADAGATAAPESGAADAFRLAGERAAALGDICLARAAFEREAEVWLALGREAQARTAFERARDAFERLASPLSPELRAGCLAHPRNRRLVQEVR